MNNFEGFGSRVDAELPRMSAFVKEEVAPETEKSVVQFLREVDGKLTVIQLARMKAFVKEEVAPDTENRTVQFLREVSEKLSESAGWIEARHATRNAQNPP